jgi:kynurenine formamidase
MKSQGVRKPRRGDVALIYTGMEAFYGGDNQEALLYSAGLGIEAVRWLASLRVAAVGADNLFLGAAAAGIEVDRFPPGHPMEGSLYPSHHVLLVENGVHILENLKLSELAHASLAEQAADEAMPNNSETSRRSRRARHPYEYAFIFNPVPIVGLSGSPGNALAVD